MNRYCILRRFAALGMLLAVHGTAQAQATTRSTPAADRPSITLSIDDAPLQAVLPVLLRIAGKTCNFEPGFMPNVTVHCTNFTFSQALEATLEGARPQVDCKIDAHGVYWVENASPAEYVEHVAPAPRVIPQGSGMTFTMQWHNMPIETALMKMNLFTAAGKAYHLPPHLTGLISGSCQDCSFAVALTAMLNASYPPLTVSQDAHGICQVAFVPASHP